MKSTKVAFFGLVVLVLGIAFIATASVARAEADFTSFWVRVLVCERFDDMGDRCVPGRGVEGAEVTVAYDDTAIRGYTNEDGEFLVEGLPQFDGGEFNMTACFELGCARYGLSFPGPAFTGIEWKVGVEDVDPFTNKVFVPIMRNGGGGELAAAGDSGPGIGTPVTISFERFFPFFFGG